MKTDELIVQLVRSARPVRLLARPGVRAVRWITFAAVVVIAIAMIVGPRHDFIEVLGQPRFLGSLAALLITVTGGALIAFSLSVPGASRSPWQRALPLIAAAAWSSIWLVALLSAGVSGGPRVAAFHSACAIQVTVGALVGGVALFAMIARAAPLQRLPAATVASLAAVATGAAVAQIACPLDDPRHHLIGHVVIALALAACGVLPGRRALSAWERRAAVDSRSA